MKTVMLALLFWRLNINRMQFRIVFSCQLAALFHSDGVICFMAVLWGHFADLPHLSVLYRFLTLKWQVI